MWELLPNEKKDEYQRMILAFASLTEVFAQKATDTDKLSLLPILNSKYQETVFQRVFDATGEDIGNTPYDASLQIKSLEGNVYQFLIGLKTFGFRSDWQKVAQFKSLNSDLQPLISRAEQNAHGCKTKDEISKSNEAVYKQLAYKLAEIRNLRIASAESNIKGFDPIVGVTPETVYHVLMPFNNGKKPQIIVGEISYDKIDVDNIVVQGCTGNKPNLAANFNFSDGKHEYRFTHADSQLLMNFKNSEIKKETWDVTFVEDAYAVFAGIADQIKTIQQKTSRITECYVWPLLKRKGEVELFSSFNAFYSVGTKLGKDQRPRKINEFLEGLEGVNDSEVKTKLRELLECYLLTDSKSHEEKLEKVGIRKQCITLVKKYGTNNDLNALRKLVYRPVRELYIPIPDSKNFHTTHTDFFGPGFGQFSPSNPKKLLKDAKELVFDLTFEPSGQTLKAFITQDYGKALMSKDNQQKLGEWILNGVFQLPEYEPLTREHLEKVGINAIKIYRVKDDEAIHLEFIWDEAFDELQHKR